MLAVGGGNLWLAGRYVCRGSLAVALPDAWLVGSLAVALPVPGWLVADLMLRPHFHDVLPQTLLP